MLRFAGISSPAHAGISGAYESCLRSRRRIPIPPKRRAKPSGSVCPTPIRRVRRASSVDIGTPQGKLCRFSASTHGRPESSPGTRIATRAVSPAPVRQIRADLHIYVVKHRPFVRVQRHARERSPALPTFPIVVMDENSIGQGYQFNGAITGQQRRTAHRRYSQRKENMRLRVCPIT